jgi:hypothetical protein
VADEADFYGPNLRAAIAKAGGEDRLKTCGGIVTGPLETQAVAWYLHVHETDVTIFPMTPATVLARQGSALALDPRFPRVTETSQWIIGSSCKGR